MSWKWEQSAGTMTSPDGARVDTGYSGHPPHVNHTVAEALPNEGPIPRGTWSIGDPYQHPHLGPVCLNLDPAEGTEAFGRSEFRIHGDNSDLNQTASHGCIILPRVVRQLIADSGDKVLEVV